MMRSVKVLRGKPIVIAVLIAAIVAVAAIAALASLVQLGLIEINPTAPSETERSEFTRPGFVFNIFGGSSGGTAQLAKPMGVSLARNRVLVVDAGRGEVKVFDEKGNTLNVFSLRKDVDRGASPPAQNYPVGIAVDESGKAYVSDMESSTIVVFDKQGKQLGLFPSDSKNRGVLRKPLALAAFGRFLYITDTGDHSVKVFDQKGDLIRKFGRQGVGEGEFSFPNGIAVAKDGSIYVADSNNSRVQVFTPEGKFQFLFQGEPRLALPRGLAIDGLNRLHVADTLGHKVSVFTLKGKFLFSYGWEEDEEEGSERQLYYPNGIAIDKEARRVYVTDKGNNRVSVWEY